MRKSNVFTAIILLCLSLVSVNLLGQAKYDKKVKIKNGDYYAVSQKGKWGVCDMGLREIVAPKYQDIKTSMIGGEFFGVKQSGKWGICNKSGREIITPRYDNFSKNLIGDNFGVMLNAKWGVCDMNGREIIAPRYDDIAKVKNGDYYGVEQNDKWGICDMNGREIIVPRFDNIKSNMIGDYFVMESNDKWGVCDTNDREIITPKYDDIAKYKGDYFRVKLNGKYGACDLNGKEVIAPRECDNLHLLGNNYFVIEKNRAQGLLNMNGELIIPIGVKDIDSWVDDVSFIKVTTFDNLIGVYSAKGELIVPVVYSCVDSYGLKGGGIRGFRVKNEDGYYGYYTTDGKLVVSPSMGIEDMSVLENHNYVIVSKGNREGLIDESGNFVVPVGMYYGFDETEDGSAIIGRKGGKCCEFYPNGKEKFVSEFVNFQEDDNHQIVAKQGKEELFRKGSDVYCRVYDDRGAVGVACNDLQIIDCEYERIEWDQVANHNIYVYKNGYWGVYDCLGNLIIPAEKYIGIGSPEKEYDYIAVKKDTKWGVCGLDGKVIIEPDEYIAVGKVLDSNGRFMVQKGNYFGKCDMNGNVAVEPVYTRIETYAVKSKDVYVVGLGDRKGAIDASGRIVIPPIYDQVEVYENPEYYSVTLNGKTGAYDREGNIIFAPEYNKLTYYIDQGFKYENESGEWVSLDISIDENGNAYYSYNSSYNEYFDEGGSYFEEKKYKKAVKSYTKALEYKQTPDAYFNIGVCYYNMEKYDDAIDYFQQCLNCNPRSTLEESAQKLIEQSRFHIEINEQTQKIAAEAVDRVFKKNRSDALSILSAILTGNNVNSNTNASGNMNYLLDPNYAVWQTQQQEYETYLLQTSGGKSMTFEQWKMIKAQADYNNINGADFNKDVDDDIEYQGKLSPDQYERTYLKWEKSAQDYYKYLTEGGVRSQDNQGNIQGKTVGQIPGGGYVAWKQGLSKAQSEMRRIRQEAAQYGVIIQQSKWETATAGY